MDEESLGSSSNLSVYLLLSSAVSIVNCVISSMLVVDLLDFEPLADDLLLFFAGVCFVAQLCRFCARIRQEDWMQALVSNIFVPSTCNLCYRRNLIFSCDCGLPQPRAVVWSSIIFRGSLFFEEGIFVYLWRVGSCYFKISSASQPCFGVDILIVSP